MRTRRFRGGTAFLAAFQEATGGAASDYIETIQKLPPDVSAQGVEWLLRIVESLCHRAGALLGSMHLDGEV